MKSKSEITWKGIGLGFCSLALKVVALGILAIRKTGEDAGESVASGFVKDTDTEKQKVNKITIGKKTGSLTTSLITLGIVGSYIVDVTETLESKPNESNLKTENSDTETMETKVLVTADAEPLDSDGDGIVDGCDIDGDGMADLIVTDGVCLTGSDTVIYVNYQGEAIGNLIYIDEYQKESGEVVSGHFRTEADSTENNNLG